MKKFLFIFFFFLLLIPLKKEKLDTVFYEESTSYYELDVSKCNVTTNNILDKVDGSIIKKLYPYIDKSYMNVLKYDLDYYEIKNINNLDEFINYYKKLLQKIGKNNLIYVINFNGVPIEKMIVYGEFSKINEIIKRNQCMSFKNIT